MLVDVIKLSGSRFVGVLVSVKLNQYERYEHAVEQSCGKLDLQTLVKGNIRERRIISEVKASYKR